MRLDFRVNHWDPDLVAYIKTLETRKPVIFGGDLNVAHLDMDIYNVSAAHIKKSAGCTPQERQSFSNMLDQGFVDTFRHFHPDAAGCYTYFSGRNPAARRENKGLRLDYFLCSRTLYEDDAAVRYWLGLESMIKPKRVRSEWMNERKKGSCCAHFYFSASLAAIGVVCAL